MCRCNHSPDPEKKKLKPLALTSKLHQGQDSSVVSQSAAYVATSSVLARVAVALVGLDFAGFATEARLADAGVAALTGVGTGGVIHAGLVIGAEVQILVAEQASPAFLASALKGLVAGAMQAPRVSLALVAEGALPPEAALALTGGLTITVLLATARRADGCLKRRGRERGTLEWLGIIKQPPFWRLSHIKYLLSTKLSSWDSHKRNTCRFFFTEGRADKFSARVLVKSCSLLLLLQWTKAT